MAGEKATRGLAIGCVRFIQVTGTPASVRKSLAIPVAALNTQRAVLTDRTLADSIWSTPGHSTDICLPSKPFIRWSFLAGLLGVSVTAA